MADVAAGVATGGTRMRCEARGRQYGKRAQSKTNAEGHSMENAQ